MTTKSEVKMDETITNPELSEAELGQIQGGGLTLQSTPGLASPPVAPPPEVEISNLHICTWYNPCFGFPE